jgi:tetratricopeptide (TPR) repeat protein
LTREIPENGKETGMNRERLCPDALYMAGREFAASGKYADAILAYSSAIEGDPNQIKARAARGMAFQRIGEHSKAIGDFGEIISRFPDWPGAFIAYYSRAVSRQALGQILEAIEDCDQAIGRKPNLTDALYLRGIARHALGWIDPAIVDLTTVLIADPTYHEAAVARGKMHYVAGRLEEAIDDLTLAMEYIPGGSPHIRDCFYFRGVAAQRLGKHREAITDLTAAIEAAPNDGPTYLLRSLSHRELGNFALARVDLEKGRHLIRDRELG